MKDNIKAIICAKKRKTLIIVPYKAILPKTIPKELFSPPNHAIRRLIIDIITVYFNSK
jgi:hypothetical protein